MARAEPGYEKRGGKQKKKHLGTATYKRHQIGVKTLMSNTKGRTSIPCDTETLSSWQEVENGDKGARTSKGVRHRRKAARPLSSLSPMEIIAQRKGSRGKSKAFVKQRWNNIAHAPDPDPTGRMVPLRGDDGETHEESLTREQTANQQKKTSYETSPSEHLAKSGAEERPKDQDKPVDPGVAKMSRDGIPLCSPSHPSPGKSLMHAAD